MTRYTVLGASGYIGRHLKRQLESDGHKVFAPGRDDPSVHGRDLGCVFYCIGLTADYNRNPAATVEAHAGIISRLVQDRNFEHLVYLSSTRLYDLVKADECDETTVLPIDPANPRHLYDISKLMGENVCLTGGAPCSVARLSGVFGISEDAPGFLSEWIARARNERDISLQSATGIVRDYIFIDDTILALRAIDSARPGGITNVASGVNLSNSEIAELFARHGRTVQFSQETARQKLPRANIARLLKFSSPPRHPLKVIGDWLDRNVVP